MGGRLVSGLNGSTVRVDLGDNDWVDIRTQITYGDRVAVRGKLLGMRIDDTGRVANGPRELDYLAADLEGIRRLVIAWGGPTFCELPAHPHDGECRPRAITVDNIAALPAEKGDLIASAVQARGNPTASPDFTSPPSSPSSTAATAESTPSASTTLPSSNAPAGPGTSS